MSYWSILAPESTTNHVLNPSFELWSAGVPVEWTSTGSPTLTQSHTRVYAGVSACQILNSTTQAERGIYQGIGGLSAGVSYRLSAWVYVTTGTIHLSVSDGPGNPITSVSSSGTGWQRLEQSWTVSGTGMLVQIAAYTAGADCIVDAVQLEQKSYSTTYCDGDTPGCRWNGIYHRSTSARNSTDRAGGRWLDLDTLSTYVTGSPGIGEPAYQYDIKPFAQKPGGEIRNIRMPERVFQVAAVIKGSSRSDLHTKRAALYGYLQPNKYNSANPTWVRYAGSGSNLSIPAYFEGGMSFTKADGFTENLALRMLSLKPGWVGETGEIAQLDHSDTLTGFNGPMRRTGGFWAGINIGGNVTVGAVVESPNGMVYLTEFTSGGKIWSWNGTAITEIGDANESIDCACCAPNGDLYVGGNFTDIGGVAYAYIARWDGSAWNAVGLGTNGRVRALWIDPTTGTLYAGGAFTIAINTGPANVTVNCIAKFTTSWAAMDAGVSKTGTPVVWSISGDGAGNVYVGGDFTGAGASPIAATNIAKWNGTAWSLLSTGLNAICYALKYTDAGLYAGGEFTTAGGNAALLIALWNGSVWAALADGLSYSSSGDIVQALDYHDGILYAIGIFDSTGSVPVPGFVAWNGTIFSPMDVGGYSGVYSLRGLLVTRQGDIWLTGDIAASDSNTVAGVTSVTNSGTMAVRPKLTINNNVTTKATSYLQWLENGTTRQRVYASLTILIDEVITLDFDAGIMTSNFGRKLYNGILPTSDFSTWQLSPGANAVSCYLSGAAEVFLTWPTLHEGAE